MNTNDHLLKIVTNETKARIEHLEVVTPSIYSMLFCESAIKNGLELNDEEKLSLELMQQECEMLTTLQSQTSQSATKLSESTTKAIGAIQEKDERVLSDVLEETKQLKEQIEKLKASMHQDTLTKTYNRKWLQDIFIDNETKECKHSGKLAVIDLNYFKEVNDKYGHIIGDKVLIFLANEFLKSRFDVVRYGGDEFLMLFPNEISQEQAAQTLHDIRAKIVRKKFKTRQESFSINFSFGISSFIQGSLLSDALDNADQKMYQDKERIKQNS